MAKKEEKELKKQEEVKEVKKEKKEKKVKEKKVREKKVKEKKVKEKKENFFKGLKSELKKVKWPKFKEVMKYTLATIVFCVLLGLFFYLVYSIVSWIVPYAKELFN